MKYARASPAAGDSAQTVLAADGTAAVQFEWVGPARPLFAACSGALTCAARALAPARACPTWSLRAEPFVCAWRSADNVDGNRPAGGLRPALRTLGPATSSASLLLLLLRCASATRPSRACPASRLPYCLVPCVQVRSSSGKPQRAHCGAVSGAGRQRGALTNDGPGGAVRSKLETSELELVGGERS